MLSWNDDSDVFSKKVPLTKAGSLPRTGTSFEAQRANSSRKSTDVPAAPAGLNRKSQDTVSPASSWGKTHSLLRGPGNAAEGTIGAEGWWHHMDNSQMNEPPADEAKGAQKAAGFVPQMNITGQTRSLWAEEAPAASQTGHAASGFSAFLPAAGAGAIAAAAAAALGGAAPVTTPQPLPQQRSDAAVRVSVPAQAAAAAATPAAPASPPGAAVSLRGEGDATIQNAAATGWWAHMDNSILNQPAETAPLDPGAVRNGERVMGGGFTPQFNVAGVGSNRYGSIFQEESQQQAQLATDIKPLEQQVAGWGPFQGQDKKPEGEGWSNFTSAS